jgi:hypothetical protein
LLVRYYSGKAFPLKQPLNTAKCLTFIIAILK